nr:AraC family transcriptional regulator [Brucella anthropi]
MAGNKNSGRPEFAPTDEDREKVRVLKAGGMTNEAIAEVIGVSEPTLRKHFSYELDIATAKVRADLLMARYRAAMGGNVQAQNKMIEQVSANAAQRKIAPEKEEKKPKLGKKEEQKLAAENVEGAFAPPAGPKLVVNN